jgi:hypothetical protein
MAAIFEIWNVSTGNLVGAYDSEREALAVVHRTVELYGREEVEDLALAREDDEGHTEPLAQGGELADWALREQGPERYAAG